MYVYFLTGIKSHGMLSSGIASISSLLNKIHFSSVLFNFKIEVKSWVIEFYKLLLSPLS